MTEVQWLIGQLMGEFCEAAQAAGKGLQFGPEDNFTDETPNVRVAKEFDEAVAVIEMLRERGINIARIEGHRADKKERVLVMMQYAREQGIITE